ncbi:hypothetical protein [Pseudomonas aeruginosa]|uniref:hypothetical protein n=1 Tax=Pseudomonas aeruginosa TaxID=287 RepID=UPI0036F08012
MSRVLFLLLAMVLAGLGQPTLAAPLPDELPAALPAAPPVAPLPMAARHSRNRKPPSRTCRVATRPAPTGRRRPRTA